MDKQRKKHFLWIFSNGYGSRGTSGGLDPTKSWMVCTDEKHCPNHCCTTDYKQPDDVNLIASPAVLSSHSFISVWNENVTHSPASTKLTQELRLKNSLNCFTFLAFGHSHSAKSLIYTSTHTILSIRSAISNTKLSAILALSRPWRSPQIATHMCSYICTSIYIKPHIHPYIARMVLTKKALQVTCDRSTLPSPGSDHIYKHEYLHDPPLKLSSAQDAMELIKCRYMYVPMYHLLKKTRTLLDALKQDGRHWVCWNYKGLCEDSAKQWSDTAMDTINGDGQIMSWPTTRLGLAEINWELIMGEKGMLMIMRCSKMVLLSHRRPHSHDPFLQLYLISSCCSTVDPGLFLTPSLAITNFDFWCFPQWSARKQNYDELLMDDHRHGRDESKPLSYFTV